MKTGSFAGFCILLFLLLAPGPASGAESPSRLTACVHVVKAPDGLASIRIGDAEHEARSRQEYNVEAPFIGGSRPSNAIYRGELRLRWKAGQPDSRVQVTIQKTPLLEPNFIGLSLRSDERSDLGEVSAHAPGSEVILSQQSGPDEALEIRAVVGACR
jgi:hypothetical protein